MPNDDLGTFPMPPQTGSAPVEPVVPDQTAVTPPISPSTPVTSLPEPEDLSISAAPTTTSPEPTPPATPTNVYSNPADIAPISSPPVTPASTAFEETPDEIPSMASPAQTENTVENTPAPEVPSLTPQSQFEESPQDKLVQANEDLIEKLTQPEIIQPMPSPEPTPVIPAPAGIPPKSGGSLAPVIIIVLLIIAGVGLAAAAYLSAQTNKLKTQLSQITQTLQEQQTTLTPTATPTVFIIPTPTSAITPTATQGATITPTLTPTPTILFTNSLLPLKNAPMALQVAINHSPNAQLILIKVDNATDPATAVTKYFFRQDLTTKTYFYVAVTGIGTPEVVDKQIFVTPDDNIPSLNDAILSNSLGIELSDALAIALAQCANQPICAAAPTKAQYIKTGAGIIWQVSLYTNGLAANPLTIQTNATTKAILYKSPEFANK